jgi:hypothetical protein
MACPTKKATKLVTREIVSVTAVNTIAFAAYSTPRRGITASEVRIIPVEYSEVMTSAPSTTMINSPRATCPVRLASAALKSEPAPCETMPAQFRTAQAMLATTRASSVQ